MIKYANDLIMILMNIDEKLEKNTGRLRGYTNKITYDSAADSPKVASLLTNYCKDTALSLDGWIYKLSY